MHQSINGIAALPQWGIHFTLLTLSLASLDTVRVASDGSQAQVLPTKDSADTDELKSFWSQLWLALTRLG